LANVVLEDVDPLDPEIVECPYEFYRAMRENGGVYQVPGRGFFLVGRHAVTISGTAVLMVTLPKSATPHLWGAADLR
jgi:hypothetical protein